MNDRRQIIKRFIPYFYPYKKLLFADLFCASLTTVCELVLPLIIRYITNEGIQDLANLTISTILQLSFLYLVLRIIDCAASYFMTGWGHIMGVRMETDMRNHAYAHLQKLSTTYYNNTKIGQIMSRITSDLFDVTEFAHHCPEEFFIAGIKTIVSIIILGIISPLLTLIVFLVIPVMLCVCIPLNLKLRAVFRKQRIEIGEIISRVEDSLLGQKVVKAFANEEEENKKFEGNNLKFQAIKEKGYHSMAAFHTTVRAFDGVMYLVVICAGGIFLVNGMITVGDLMAYVLYVTTLIATIRKIVEFAEQFQRGVTGIERFFEIMDSDIEIFDEEDAKELKNPEGVIDLKKVSFMYSDDHNVVFTDLNLHINAGEKVAIVGPSGGGKTTLCNLLPRFFDVSEGEITIDGHNVKEYTLKSLRQSIGMVQQEVYLFSGTVAENIGYGKLESSREEIIEAAKSAGAHEFIMGLKDGYDTYVGERGVKLSGGQKQRISIARVFLKNPPIIILDEATSALDNESEFAVAKSLSKLSVGRTTITIAHRLSTIQNADRIIVLTDQGIEEEGNHEELLQRRGIYYNFYEMASQA